MTLPEPGETLPFGVVLFPLRYDIYCQGLAFRKAQQEYGYNRDAMAEGTKESIMWTHLDVMVDVHDQIGHFDKSPTPARRANRQRRYHPGNLKKLIHVHKSISENGWQGQMYFKKLTDPDETYTSSGYLAPPGYFLTNGQHRSTVLIALGYRELKPVMWDLSVRDSLFRPLDTTYHYIKRGLVTEEQFVDFARLRFDVPQKIKNIDWLRAWAVTAELPPWFFQYLAIYWGEGYGYI